MKKLFIFIVFLFVMLLNSTAQKIAVKSNLLYDLTTTFNLGLELSLSPKWTLDISANYNPWTFKNNKKWKHWLLQPEARYWFCEKMNGHFIGPHLLGGEFNVGNVHLFDFLGTNFSTLKDHRVEGWLIGAGISYGYSWILNRHWNIEAVLGIGYAYGVYSKYLCPNCGDKIASDQHHNYVGPTKAAVNLIYVF